MARPALWAELEPSRSYTWERIVSSARSLLSCFDGLDVPDQPLGSRYSAPVVGAGLAAVLDGGRVMVHVRTVDMALNAVKAVSRSLLALGVKRIVYLRGDPVGPRSGVSPEEALEAVRDYRLRRGLKAGLIVSLRKSLEEIELRTSLQPDMILVLNLSGETLWKLREIRRRFGGEVYPYLIIGSGLRERGVTSYAVEGLKDALELAYQVLSEGLADGFIVSSPGRDDVKLELCKGLREVVQS